MKREVRVNRFVGEIQGWYARHKRALPWRDLEIEDDTERAYRVLVSEIMLQQTQVPRVIVTFKNFLRTFPTLASLAQASNREVLIAWRGMGYNSRALRLRDAAKMIVERCHPEPAKDDNAADGSQAHHDSGFPTSMDDLMSIPGIGHYTAAAIRNFAFNIPTPCIDTNIRRILHRTFVGPENADGTWEKHDEYLLKIAGEVLIAALNDGMTAADWHAALMDFSSLVQTKKNPRWEICPLTKKAIMKATRKNFPKSFFLSPKSEPGRLVGSTFIPNRIFRGRVVDVLRDAPQGLTLAGIGKQVAIDWSPSAHRKWLQSVLRKLLTDRLIRVERGKYVLG